MLTGTRGLCKPELGVRSSHPPPINVGMAEWSKQCERGGMVTHRIANPYHAGSSPVAHSILLVSSNLAPNSNMEVWQSLAECTCLENRRLERVREFESHRFHHYAGIAQLVERVLAKH